MSPENAPNTLHEPGTSPAGRAKIAWSLRFLCVVFEMLGVGVGASADGNVRSLVLHHQLLGERLYLYSYARFLVVGCIAAGAFFARDVVGIEDLDVAGLLQVALCLFLYNLAVFVVVRNYRDAETAIASRRLLVGIMNATITLDFVFLTLALWLIGGAQSPFKVFYVFHVILACVLLPRFMAFVHTFLGYLMFAALVLTVWFGWIPPHYPAGAVANPAAADGRYVLTVLVVQGMLMALTVILLTSLTQLLRRGEAELRQANYEVTRYSDLLRNLLRIVIHDVKSPVAAAIMSLYRLELGDGGILSEKQREVVEGIQRRLGNLTILLRDFQVLAAFSSADLDKHGQEVDMVPLLRSVVQENQDLASARRHSLLADVPGSLPPVHGIPRLLEECVANLVTNAIKYTPEGGKIVVRAFTRGTIVRIEVEDNGIGISPADQPRLFQDFVRIRREDAPTICAEGSGLGLTIVHRIAEMHKGTSGVISELNRGSVFYIELPATT